MPVARCRLRENPCSQRDHNQQRHSLIRGSQALRRRALHATQRYTDREKIDCGLRGCAIQSHPGVGRTRAGFRWPEDDGSVLDYARDEAKLYVTLRNTMQPGETHEVTVHYHGRPLEVKRAPWDGGF